VKCIKCDSVVKNINEAKSICTNCGKEYNRPEVWSRVVGYIRPTSQWHEGKQTEFADRNLYEQPGQTKLKVK